MGNASGMDEAAPVAGQPAIRVLGGAVAVGAGEVAEPVSGLAGMVLAGLAARANTNVSADSLAWLLWQDDQPATATASLQMHVSRLRKALAGVPAEVSTI